MVPRTKEPLDESEKVGLKLNIQKTKIMASGSITSWQIDGETNKQTNKKQKETLFWGAPKSLWTVTVILSKYEHVKSHQPVHFIWGCFVCKLHLK